MDLLKKNPVFCFVCVVALLVFSGITALAFMESDKLAKSKGQVMGVDSQLNMLLCADPAPTVENVEAAQRNAEKLAAKLVSIREALQPGARLTVSDDGTRVMSGLQKYISSYRRLVATHQNAAGEAAKIEIPADFAFGFEKYLKETNISKDAAVIPQLDKQRQVLSYILDQLIAAGPASIQSVEREILGDANNDEAGFRINPAVSARCAVLVWDVLLPVYSRPIEIGFRPIISRRSLLVLGVLPLSP
jgi:hypothetical protein